jgi:hypothetical protein
VTRGFVLVADAGPLATPQAGDQWARLQQRLVQAIEMECGPAVRDVAVEVRSSTEAHVRFRAASKAEADQCWDQIKQLPELAQYKKLNVEVKTSDMGR